MDANKIFKDVLEVIENSSLNHSIYKTPFTATILLKSSFVKYFSDNSQSDHEAKNINRKDIITEETRILKNENIEMKAQLKELEIIVEEQKIVIAEKTKEEFTEKERRELKAAEFLTEVLKMKSENDQLEKKVKLALSDSEKYRMEKNQVVKNLKASGKALEATETDLRNVNIEKVALVKKLEQTVKEMETLKMKQEI